MYFVLKSSVVLIVVLIAAAATAQHQEVVGLPDFPVPAWPESGVIPPELKDKYVFIDVAQNQYVVAYPENLGLESFQKDGPGLLRIARYDLLRNVEPVVFTAITPAAGSQRYKYTYSVANAASAKQSIDQWALILPALSRADTIKHPDGWHAIIQAGRTFKVKQPQWIRTGAAAIWSFEKPEQVIEPGTTKAGFELESEMRPGFTLAYLRKAESVESRVATHGNVPKAVKDQIDLLLAVEYNSKTVLTLGPKFDKTADNSAVASDFSEGISLLTRAGTLDANSDFVKTTLIELKLSPVKLTATARTPAETEILNALKLSLQF